MELSKAAQKYRPGHGVYRSAYKNAMRLARTEINAAYRTAEWQQYQNDPTIIGFRIALSNNHTTLRNGKKVDLKDICDELQGVYPKTFKWTGWHPQCRCEMYPVTFSRDDRKDYFKALFDGTEAGWKPESTVENPPPTFNDWVSDNRERAKGWQNMPHFVRDNMHFVKGDFKVGTYTPDEMKFTASRNAQAAMQQVLEKLKGLYPDIPNTELAAIHHYTRNGGNYRQLNKQMDNNTLSDFNMASRALIVKGLDKLPVYQGTVYRGAIMKRTDFERVYGGDIGSVVKQDRFVSSSRDMNIAMDFATRDQSKMRNSQIQVFIKIQSKNGRDIERISEFNGIFATNNQREVLFGSNTSFRIVSRKTLSNGIVELKMVEI